MGDVLEYTDNWDWGSNPSSPIISGDKPTTAIINHNQKRDAAAIGVKIYPLRPIPTNIYKPILPYGRNLVAPTTAVTKAAVTCGKVYLRGVRDCNGGRSFRTFLTPLDPTMSLGYVVT